MYDEVPIIRRRRGITVLDVLIVIAALIGLAVAINDVAAETVGSMFQTLNAFVLGLEVPQTF